MDFTLYKWVEVWGYVSGDTGTWKENKELIRPVPVLWSRAPSVFPQGLISLRMGWSATDGHTHKVSLIPLKEGMLIWTEPVTIKLKQWQKALGLVDS